MGCGQSAIREEEKEYGQPGQDMPIAYRVHIPRDPHLPGGVAWREGDNSFSHILRASTLQQKLDNAPTAAVAHSLHQVTRPPRSKRYPKNFSNREGYYNPQPAQPLKEYPAMDYNYKTPPARAYETRSIADSQKNLKFVVHHPHGPPPQPGTRPLNQPHLRADEGYAPKAMSRQEAQELRCDQLEWYHFADQATQSNGDPAFSVCQSAKNRMQYGIEMNGQTQWTDDRQVTPGGLLLSELVQLRR